MVVDINVERVNAAEQPYQSPAMKFIGRDERVRLINPARQLVLNSLTSIWRELRPGRFLALTPCDHGVLLARSQKGVVVRWRF